MLTHPSFAVLSWLVFNHLHEFLFAGETSAVAPFFLCGFAPLLHVASSSKKFCRVKHSRSIIHFYPLFEYRMSWYVIFLTYFHKASLPRQICLGCLYILYFFEEFFNFRLTFQIFLNRMYLFSALNFCLYDIRYSLHHWRLCFLLSLIKGAYHLKVMRCQTFRLSF